MNWLRIYYRAHRKAFTGLAGALLTWAAATYTTGQGAQFIALAAALLTAAGVLGIPNDQAAIAAVRGQLQPDPPTAGAEPAPVTLDGPPADPEPQDHYGDTPPTAPEPQIVRRVIAETIVEGKRLGRMVLHDARSLMHQMPSSDPPTTAIEWPRRVPILDQGALGSCTGNATVGALGTDPSYAALNVLFGPGLSFDEAEAVLIYSGAEKLDGGAGYPPEDNGSSGLSVAKVAKALGYIASYLHCTSIAGCFTAIKTGPFLVGSEWLTGMDSPDAHGVVHATGSVRGGHEYLCRGYDPATDLWLFDNSWGPSWGRLAGSFKMSTADFTKLLAAQGDATVLLPLPNAPAPAPTPTPTPDGSYVEVTDPAALARLDELAARHHETPEAYLTARVLKW